MTDEKKTPPTITVNMDKRCAGCNRKGACDNGLCLKCSVARMMERLK